MEINVKELKKDAKISMEKKTYEEGYVYAQVNNKKEMFPIGKVYLAESGLSLGEYVKQTKKDMKALSDKVDEAVKKYDDLVKQMKGSVTR